MSLGWTISSDVQAWNSSSDTESLFPGGGVGQEEPELFIVSEDFFLQQGSMVLPPLLNGTEVPAVYLDRSDLIRQVRYIYSTSFRRFNLIYRCHSNRRYRTPDNVSPIVFGISERIAHACQQGSSINKRQGVMWNFRHKEFPHTVRLWAEKNIRPAIEQSGIRLDTRTESEAVAVSQYNSLMLRQTEGRHFISFYERLQSSLAVACFGGWFLFPLPQKEASFLCLAGRKFFTSVHLPTSCVAQWDSWRMWEAFAAGAAVIHLDFTKHGFLLGGPVPTPMKHYVAVDPEHPESFTEVLKDPERLARIGFAGREWALSHYTSKALAERMLASLGLAVSRGNNQVLADSASSPGCASQRSLAGA